MSVLSIPNTFATGTTIQAAPFNANFTAIQTAVNSIDNTNIGAAGIFASQLIPTTAAQATFGGLVGYKFYPATASAVPLTISGFTGQSVDLLDVTLTSGGTNAFKIGSTGAATFGFALSAAGLTSTAGIAAGGAITGATTIAASGNIASGGVLAAYLTAQGYTNSAGQISSAATTTSGYYLFGGSASSPNGAGVLSWNGTSYSFYTAGTSGTIGNPQVTISGAGAISGVTTIAASSGITGQYYSANGAYGTAQFAFTNNAGGSNVTGLFAYGATTASISSSVLSVYAIGLTTPQVAAIDASGNLGILGGLHATGVTAGTGTVQGASNGSTTAYLPPVYTAAGAALASTTHIVQGFVYGTSGSSTVVTLSGAAAFSSATSYAVACTTNTNLGDPVLYVTQTSGTSFTVTFSGTTGSNQATFVAIGS